VLNQDFVLDEHDYIVQLQLDENEEKHQIDWEDWQSDS